MAFTGLRVVEIDAEALVPDAQTIGAVPVHRAAGQDHGGIFGALGQALGANPGRQRDWAGDVQLVRRATVQPGVVAVELEGVPGPVWHPAHVAQFPVMPVARAVVGGLSLPLVKGEV